MGYTYVKDYQIIHFKYDTQFIVCQLNLNEAVKKEDFTDKTDVAARISNLCFPFL